MIQKIQIISNNICYGPPPEHETEVEQHLTISSSGRIWFNAYNFMGGFDNYKKGRTFQLCLITLIHFSLFPVVNTDTFWSKRDGNVIVLHTFR